MVSRGKISQGTAKARPAGRGKKQPAPAGKPEYHKPVSLAPVVVEAGIRTRASLRHLEKGAGPLMHEIGQIVHAIHASVPGPVPITIVYREKRSSGSRSTSPFEIPLI
jgi:hypothetical protein